MALREETGREEHHRGSGQRRARAQPHFPKQQIQGQQAQREQPPAIGVPQPVKQGGIVFPQAKGGGQKIVGALPMIDLHAFGDALNAQPVVVGHRSGVPQHGGVFLQVLPQDDLLGQFVTVYAIISGCAKAQCKNQCKNHGKPDCGRGELFFHG